MSPSLKGLDLVDNPNNVPDGYKPEIDWEGVGLLRYCIVPHYMSNHPESEAVNSLADYLKGNGIEYKTLSDGKVIIEESWLYKSKKIDRALAVNRRFLFYQRLLDKFPSYVIISL